VGAFTGGSIAISDVLGGFGQFAPGTLGIKALEGAIVGVLYRELRKVTSNSALSASLAVVFGGSEMVLGYFLYEMFILGYTLPVALAEVPFNIIQLIVGLVVAVPVMFAVQRVFPQLKS
jgi:uncharacterized membrane protein